MTAVEQALKYTGYTVLPGHDSVFEKRTGRGGHRWDGSMLDVIFRDAGVNTVSFTDAANALTVLTQNGKVRRKNRPRIGDVAFLADGYVGIVQDTLDSFHSRVRIGWHAAPQGKRTVALLRVHNTIDVLAFADPALPVRQRDAVPAVAVTERKKIADLLSLHPAVGTFVAPENFAHAYARWQRYCGYGPDKANGEPDVRSLERLCREERGKP